MSDPKDTRALKKPVTGLRSGPRARVAFDRVVKARAAKPAFTERGNEADKPRRGGAAGDDARGTGEREGFRKPWQKDDAAPRRDSRGPRPDGPPRARPAQAEGSETRRPPRDGQFSRDGDRGARSGSGERPPRAGGERPPRTESAQGEGRRFSGEAPREVRAPAFGRSTKPESRERSSGERSSERPAKNWGGERPPRTESAQGEGRRFSGEAPREVRAPAFGRSTKPESREGSSGERSNERPAKNWGADRPPRPESGQSEGRRFAREAKPEGQERRPAERSERSVPPRGDRPASNARVEQNEARPRRPLPRAHVDPTVGVRVSKLMAERGLCSRREADEFIERGWVFVNGVKMAELGARVAPDAEITLSPHARNQQHSQVTILLNKPVGFVSGQPEPGYEPAVTLITAANQYAPEGGLRFKPMHLKSLAPAGRLDIDSTGILVMTQNGRIARSLIGEDSKIEKEYLVRVEGQLIENGLALLNHGLELDGKALRPAEVEWLNEGQLRFVLREGRKRQIRRMCELVGLHVTGLKRVRIGRVKLGDLPQGMWRYLREDEAF